MQDTLRKNTRDYRPSQLPIQHLGKLRTDLQLVRGEEVSYAWCHGAHSSCGLLLSAQFSACNEEHWAGERWVAGRLDRALIGLGTSSLHCDIL